jgi:hypothetical protein
LLFSLFYHDVDNNLPIKYGIYVPINYPTNHYVYPNGIYFLKYIQTPWSIQMSKRTGSKYYYKMDNQSSTYNLPLDEDSFFADPK